MIRKRSDKPDEKSRQCPDSMTLCAMSGTRGWKTASRQSARTEHTSSCGRRQCFVKVQSFQVQAQAFSPSCSCKVSNSLNTVPGWLWCCFEQDSQPLTSAMFACRQESLARPSTMHVVGCLRHLSWRDSIQPGCLPPLAAGLQVDRCPKLRHDRAARLRA